MGISSCKALFLAGVLLSAAAFGDDRKKGFDEVTAVDPSFFLKMIQGFGLWVVDRCTALEPHNGALFRRAYTNWPYSKYKIETRVNGKVIDSDSSFQAMVESKLGKGLSPAACANIESVLTAIEGKVDLPAGYLKRFDAASERSWISPDGNEFVVAVSGAKSETLYFNNDANRICYKFSVPGSWRPMAETGLLESEAGRGRAGVAIYSPQQLAGSADPDAVVRASNLLISSYEATFATPLTTKKLSPFPSSRPGTMKWLVSWNTSVQGTSARVEAHKVFLELAPSWVAQISVTSTADDESTYRQVIDSLGTTRDRECYWPLIRQEFPHLLDQRTTIKN